MTCQAYPGSGIITLVWMGLFHYGVSSFYCRSILLTQGRAVFYCLIVAVSFLKIF